ncbi:hypothetical protein GGI01_002737 [Coemansia sp. RSA 376]|nr:hypothetical protein LPJ71_001200 [Coemansia sp. S17]KAJ2012968.1 hypothetical protein GGI14_005599 [Coemansia sp. S680]KAJ2032594.1 hypothetical protein H4S03_006171 [Coemansia sp. S3946]KAJ2045055.1 hypothetical protein H4S04_005865 [Coemansia sp. S16]KAJ2067523.1 hypothetical protein GGH13_005274 [Coemansia sp. S155-1]KAJ2095161.1 hypothetical protein GGI16_005307 [Coemansia sp. S142-1]KAJ2100595.1 hypothetical protein GGI09_002199 [Coemansia sp. S100]KAJ2112708.1 hypothetical protein 
MNSSLPDTNRDTPQDGCLSPGALSSRTVRSVNREAHVQLAHEQRTAMLENFDMEVEDKIRLMRAQLDADKMDLILKADCDVAQLPKCVRDMPLVTFLREYGGDVSAAVRGVLKIDDKGRETMVPLPETPLVIRARRKVVAKPT